MTLENMILFEKVSVTIGLNLMVNGMLLSWWLNRDIVALWGGVGGLAAMMPYTVYAYYRILRAIWIAWTL